MLKPFQHTGAQFLAERTRALLGDEPGCGKSGQLIEAANLVDAGTAAIVCPDIGVEHWRRECQKWGLKARPLIISWDDVHDVRDALQSAPTALGREWDVLVLDECHWGKNPHARRTKAVFGKGGLGWYARRIWAASGTPAPNNASELWPMLRAFNKTKMGHEEFTQYFCRVHPVTGKILGNREDHIQELRDTLKLFSLRRLKRDVLPELGEIDVQEWYVKPRTDFVGASQPTFEQFRQENNLRNVLAGSSDDEIMSFLASPNEDFSTLRRYNALLKAPAVFDTVKFELENGLLEKIVIYGYHTEAMRALHQAFGRFNIDSTLIIGDTPREERDALIQRWKKKGQVLIASSIIAGTALDFSAAHQGIMLELGWVPGDNAQAIQRMHRHGQANPVTVRVAMGTPIDEIVTGVVLRKTKDLAQIFS